MVRGVWEWVILSEAACTLWRGAGILLTADVCVCVPAGNGIQDPGATALAEAVKGNTTLETLDLARTWRV